MRKYVKCEKNKPIADKTSYSLKLTKHLTLACKENISTTADTKEHSVFAVLEITK